MIRQKSENSIDPKSDPFSLVREDYRDNSDEMKEKLDDYILSLHGISESTKDLYLSQVRVFSRFLLKRGIKRFEDVARKDIDLFLSGYPNESTKDNYVVRLRHFYGEFLKMPDLIEHLKLSKYDIQPVVPSELLTPEEIVKLANEASKRREMYKVIILTLYESCARISEVLQLRIGDVVFGSVIDKEGKRKLICTLFFKRSKGGVNKQPVVLTMFASELKRWVDNRQAKKDSLTWFFPSPYNRNEPVGHDAVSIALWNAGERLGIKKRTNPHWLKHSGLSYFANHHNYSEQLLKWRAGRIGRQSLSGKNGLCNTRRKAHFNQTQKLPSL